MSEFEDHLRGVVEEAMRDVLRAQMGPYGDLRHSLKQAVKDAMMEAVQESVRRAKEKQQRDTTDD